MAFEGFLGQKDSPQRAPRWRRRLTYALSLSLHVGLLLVGAFQSLWRVDEISPRGVTVTFAAAMAAPAPPPPPPPAAAPAVAKPKPHVARPKPDEVVQPREEPAAAPEAPAAEAGSDEADPAGEVGGSESGVAGGVIGGTAVTATPPPKIVEPAPVMLAPSVGVGQRLSDVNDPKFRPTLPPVLNRPGNIVRGLFKICVSTEGHVSDVKLLRSADPLVDADWANVIRRWQYKPFTINGHPTPFCHPLMLQVQSVN